MIVKNGKCRLVGFVDLGKIHDDMEKLSGTTIPYIRPSNKDTKGTTI